MTKSRSSSKQVFPLSGLDTRKGYTYSQPWNLTLHAFRLLFDVFDSATPSLVNTIFNFWGNFFLGCSSRCIWTMSCNFLYEASYWNWKSVALNSLIGTLLCPFLSVTRPSFLDLKAKSVNGLCFAIALHLCLEMDFLNPVVTFSVRSRLSQTCGSSMKFFHSLDIWATDSPACTEAPKKSCSTEGACGREKKILKNFKLTNNLLVISCDLL